MVTGTPRFKKGDRVRVKREGVSKTGIDADNLRGYVGTITEASPGPMAMITETMSPDREVGTWYTVVGRWAHGSRWEQVIPEDLLEPAHE